MGEYAWVTLATNDSYSLGALVLAHSLRRVATRHELVVLVTPGVTTTMREKLAAVFSLVQEVNVLDSNDKANLALLARPELGITFTKLHCWRLTQYKKCVFLDADTLVVKNCDELFEREEFSAAPDVGWPDCFNSGVFVYKPSEERFTSLIEFATSTGSFDGGDQGLLNMYFNDWARQDISKHLPFIYNMCSTATYSYLPAFKQFGQDVRIIHFIGVTKPWLQYFDSVTGVVQAPSDSHHIQTLLQLWWNIFCENVHPQLTPFMQNNEQLNPNMISRQATSTLAPIWHVSPIPSSSSSNDDPDFSEFQDPWNNYTERQTVFIDYVDNDRIDFYNFHSDQESCLRNTEESDVFDFPVNRIPSTEPCTEFIEYPTTQSDAQINGHLERTCAGLAGALAKLTLGEPRSPEQSAWEEHMRKQSWEQGHIDYMGRDSFDNIWKKICQTISDPTSLSEEPLPSKDPIETKEISTEEDVEVLPEAPLNTPESHTPTASVDVVDRSKEETLNPENDPIEITMSTVPVQVAESVLQPVIPIRMKNTKPPPSTPTVTPPTPPVNETPPSSPTKTSGKKMVKKTTGRKLSSDDSFDGTDPEGGGGKKILKKNMKKTTKKSKDDVESSSLATDKPKISCKVGKKKCCESLGTDVPIPETPPPPIDAPIPPKRKSKSCGKSNTDLTDRES